MIVTSVVLSFMLGYVPYIGGMAEFTFLCWVDALVALVYVYGPRLTCIE